MKSQVPTPASLILGKEYHRPHPLSLGQRAPRGVLLIELTLKLIEQLMLVFPQGEFPFRVLGIFPGG